MANRIAALRKKRGLSQSDLGDKIGVHWVTVSKLERGKMQLTDVYMDLIAEALGVAPTDLLPPRSVVKEVGVLGYINPDGSISELTEGEDLMPIAKLVDESEEDFVAKWLAVSGNALWPIFRDGDLIRFVSVQTDEAQHYIGRFATVVTKEGRHIVGRLEPGAGSLFNVIPANGPPVVGVDIKTLAVADIARFPLPWQPKFEPSN